MHNLKINFDKILEITKSALAQYLLPDGNFQYYSKNPKMTDSEVVTLSITAESLGIDSENLLFSKLKTEYSADFPNLIHRSNFNRRRKRLCGFITLVAEEIATQIDPENRQFILDSIPIPICQNTRIPRSKICKDDNAVRPTRGYHASHKIHFYGFKFQLIITRSGVPKSVGLTSANVHDVRYLDLLKDEKLAECELIADKGYLSLGYQTSLFEQDKIKLITPLRSNMKGRETAWNPSYRYIRKRIEPLFSQLCDHMLLKRNYAKSLDGLLTRICSKVSSVATLQFINFKNGNPLNRIKHALVC